MTTPTPPRLVGDPKTDNFAIVKYLGDLFRSFVTEDQLPQSRSRIAAVDVTAISAAGADGKVTSRTANVVGAVPSPPNAVSGNVNPISNPAVQADFQKMADKIDALVAWTASVNSWAVSAVAACNAIQAELNADTKVALEIVQAANKQ